MFVHGLMLHTNTKLDGVRCLVYVSFMYGRRLLNLFYISSQCVYNVFKISNGTFSIETMLLIHGAAT